MEKPPYPSDERGLPVVPPRECYEVCLRGAKTANKHHLAFNRRMYTSSLERAYRESACMIVRMCACRHDALHATYDPPVMPEAAVMRGVIAGNILPPTELEAGIQVEIRTQQTINEENWNAA